MDIKTRGIVDRLQEILRAKVNDPFDRGDNISETIPTGSTSITLSNKKIKNVNQAIGISSNDEYYRFKDFSIIFDNPSVQTEYPEIVFNTSTSEDIDINYHYNETWIYPTWPSTKVDNALITIQHTGQENLLKHLGNRVNSDTKGKSFVSNWQIDIWVGENVSVTDPDSSHKGYFAGGKLCDYISDRVKEALLENQEHLRKQGVHDTRLSTERNGDFGSDIDQYRKVLEFLIEHDYEW